MLIQWRLQGRSTIAWWHMSTATCRPMRISSRPKHSAAVFESLTGQPDGRVELRPHVLQADDCRDLDKLCLIKVGTQPLHKLVSKGAATVPDADRTRQREIVDAFLAASRGGDFEALLAVLDPDVVVRADRVAVPAGAPTAVRGAPAVAKNALAFSRRARFAQVALVNGVAGIVVAPNGRLRIVLAFTIRRVVEIDVVADRERLRQLNLGVFND